MIYKTINPHHIFAMEEFGQPEDDIGQPEPTDETPIYISPYETKPKPKPRSKKTEEEIKQQKREIATRHYYENYEYKRLQQRYTLNIT